jgi:ribonuclease HI
MAQLSIFNNNSFNSKFELYVDGASRNNPGQAGAGIYIIKDNQALVKLGYYLGNKTNNQAEYLALLLGLILIKKYITDKDNLEIMSDSLLLVKQVSQEYKVLNPILANLNNYARRLLNGLNYKIFHILRDKNVVADKLANQAIDKKLNIPDEIKKELKEKLDIDI